LYLLVYMLRYIHTAAARQEGFKGIVLQLARQRKQQKPDMNLVREQKKKQSDLNCTISSYETKQV